MPIDDKKIREFNTTINGVNNEITCFDKMKKCKILFTYNSKNRKDKQLYTVITDREILIGGTNEKGYMLRFWPENTPSNTCMAYNDILRILSGKIISQHVFEVRII